MEEPKEKLQVDLSNVDAINNMDTARLALRWALERLHALEKSRGESTEKAEREARLREKAEEDHRALQRTLALRNEEATQRELYYAKLEEFLSLKLEGKLDASALAKRETEAARLQEFLRQKQAHLDKAALAKREELEREYQKLKSEAGQEAQAAVQRSEESMSQRRANMDKEYVSKMISLREKEFQLKQQDKHLSDRQAHFQEFYANQRAQLDRQVQSAREEVEDQVNLRLKNAEQLDVQRRAAWEASWAQEKTLLLKELAEWRNKAQEHLPRLLELEARQAESQAQKNAFEMENASFRAEIAQWKKKALEQAQALHELQLRSEIAEAAARRAKEDLDRENAGRKALEERELSLRTEAQNRLDALEGSLRAEIAQWKKKALEQAPQALHEAQLRAEAAEASARQGKEDLEREAAKRKLLEEREVSLRAEAQARLDALETSWLGEKALLLKELAEWQNKAQQPLPGLLELQARQAESAVHRRALEAEIASLREESAQWKKRALELEQAPQALGELQLRAETAEASARQAKEDLEREAARRKLLETSWEGEKTFLLKELADWRNKAQEPLPRLREIEARQAESEVRKRALETDIAALRAESAQWKQRALALEEAAQAVVESKLRVETAEAGARKAKENLERETAKRKLLEESAEAGQAEQQRRLEDLEAAARQNEAVLRRRVRDLEDRAVTLSQEHQQRELDLNNLKDKLEREKEALLAELGGGGSRDDQRTPRRLLSQLEDAHNAVERLANELEQEKRRRQELEKREEEKAPRRLLVQLEAANSAAERLREDLSQETRRRKAWEQSAREQLPGDILEQLKRMDAVEAKARQTGESLELELARRGQWEEREKALLKRVQEMEQLSRESAVLREELKLWKQKAEAAPQPDAQEEAKKGLEAEFQKRVEALNAERSAWEAAALRREQELQEMNRRVSEDFEKKRSEFELLTEALEGEIAKLIAKHRTKPDAGS